MRIAFIADLHVGNHRAWGGKLDAGVNVRAQAIVTALGQACNRALALDAKVLVVCGDLFDTDHPTPQLIRAVGEILGGYCDLGGEVYILLGNHDASSDQPWDSALAPFGLVSRSIHVADAPTSARVGTAADNAVLLLVPYQSGPARDWFTHAVDEALVPARASGAGVKPSTPLVLAFHLGIEDGKTPAFLRGASDSVHVDAVADIVRAHDLAAVFAGNWHDHQAWDAYDGVGTAGQYRRTPIIQCGALVPTGFDNPGVAGLYGSLVLYDTRTHLAVREELPGPRFAVTRAAQEDVEEAVEELLASPEAQPLYVAWKVPPSELSACRVVMQTISDTHLRLGGWRVEADAAAAASKLRTTAAQLACAGVSGADAIVTEYVAAMTLPSTVDRSAVAAAVRSFLTDGE